MSSTYTPSEAVLKIFSTDMRDVALAKGESRQPSEQPKATAEARTESAPRKRDYAGDALGLLG